ncbi:MAG TPA: riboflavin synthase [Chromatiales bacterium]|nr:riboflavin synthase [Chromatiales bacterium]
MFTGIIQAMGEIEAMEPRAGDARLRVACGELDLGTVSAGDSIAVSGVCLTALDIDGEGFSADVSSETLRRTTLGGLAPGASVNLEKSLLPTTPLGGHFVSGHVDGVGEVLECVEDARSVRMRLAAPAELARYIAVKGSVCVDGVSLTVNEVDGARFGVNIIPHTLEHTTLGGFAPGRRFNIEVDLIARYLERLFSADATAGAGAASRHGRLAGHGFPGRAGS